MALSRLAHERVTHTVEQLLNTFSNIRGLIMNYPYHPRKNGTVVVLGAGASFGSSLRHPPPVMRDFVRVGKNLVSEDYSDLWNFLASMGYSPAQLDNGNPNLEELYSVLHTLSKGLWHDNEDEFIQEIGQAFWKIPPVYFLESFIMEVTDFPSVEALRKTCSYHDYVVSQLSKGDTIISFNYDLIADASVASNHQWSELDGYGFPCIGLLNWYKNKFDPESSSDIALLKPHGSLNWKPYDPSPFNVSTGTAKTDVGIHMNFPSFHQRLNRSRSGTNTKIEIRPLSEIKDHAYEGLLNVTMARYYDEFFKGIWRSGVEAPRRDTLILPPNLDKFGDPGIPEELSQVWSLMRQALTLAQEVLIIGYSFPKTDLEFNTLFRLSMNNNQGKNTKIRVVDLDLTLIDRIREMVPGIKVEHIANTFKEHAK